MKRLRSLFRQGRFEAEMTEEMQHHVELQTERNLQAGMNPADARYVALRRFGNVASLQEHAREQRKGRVGVWLEQAGQDLRYAVRQLGRARGFTLVVIFTLAFGIGATTAIYSVVDRVVLHPLPPGIAAKQLVQISERLYDRGFKDRPFFPGVSSPVIQRLLAARERFADLTWYEGTQLSRRGSEFVSMENGSFVAANFFAVFGVSPQLGRTFAPDDPVTRLQVMKPLNDGVVVLSHAWWQSAFAADPAIVGRTIELGERHFAVIGIMPAHFQYPSSWQKFWIAAEPRQPNLQFTVAANTRLIASLRPGTSLEQAGAMLQTVTRQLEAESPAGEHRFYGEQWRARPGGLHLSIRPLLDDFQAGPAAEGIRRTLWGFSAALAFVLAIVCANIANLILARTEQRRHELALRAALGAGRSRLLRQLLTENLLLAGLGGVASLLVTGWGIKLLESINTMPRLRAVDIDLPVLGVAAGAALLAGLAFGLIPAWRAGRPRGNEALVQGGPGATAGARTSRFRGLLVVVQVALAMILLTGAGLMLRSVVRLLRVDPGFDPANLIEVALPWNMSMQQGGHADYAARRNAWFEQIHGRLSALPGVTAVGLAAVYVDREFKLDDRPDPVRVFPTGCGIEDADFFRAMRIPLLAGRHFNHGDIGARTGVIINESMAQLCWPGADPLGKSFRSTDQKDPRSYEVIGLVGDARVDRFDETVKPAFFRPYQDFGGGLAGWAPRFVIRTEREPGMLVPAVRRELKAIDPQMAEPVILNSRQKLYDATAAQRTYRNYLVVFALAGLLLSAFGTYGVLAYSVVERTREIGIRIAIGAERRQVMAMVMGQGVRLVAVGAAIGLVGALGLTRLMEKQLFQTDPRDAIVLAAAVAVLAAIGLFASWLPARRATRVDPMVALKAE